MNLKKSEAWNSPGLGLIKNYKNEKRKLLI